MKKSCSLKGSRLLCVLLTAGIVAAGGCGGQTVERLGQGRGYLSGLEPVETLPTDFAAGYGDFAVAMLRQLYAQNSGESGNVFFSPVSIAIAAGMLTEGAEGATRDQLLALFNAADTEKLTTGCRDLQSLMTGNPKHYFRSANSLWVDDSLREAILTDYLERLDAGYGALVAAEPFDQTLPDKVNGWVDEITKGMITEALQPPMDETLELLLCNALLFDGEWKLRFDKADTKEEVFHGMSGDIELPMMHRTDKEDGRYFENDKVTAALLDYKDDRTAMLVALPKGDLDALIDDLTAEEIRGWTDGMESCSLSLTMPRFSLRYRTEQLETAFSSLGATEAFQPSADFSRMLQNGGIYVHTAIHEAVLEVDENGTRAAAFTGFGLRKNAAPLPRELTLDRPFLCAIVDKPTGALLFLGTVEQPERLS